MPVTWGCHQAKQVKERICIVDDDEWVADSLKVLLEIFGFEVQSYSSGCEFLADKRHCAVGCLLIDQHLHGMTGLDVVDRLQKECGSIPTILISGRLDNETRARASSLGVMSVIDKPFAPTSLVELIRTALRERN
jgi:FixJ family two-component response regulator